MRGNRLITYPRPPGPPDPGGRLAGGVDRRRHAGPDPWRVFAVRRGVGGTPWSWPRWWTPLASAYRGWNRPVGVR